MVETAAEGWCLIGPMQPLARKKVAMISACNSSLLFLNDNELNPTNYLR